MRVSYIFVSDLYISLTDRYVSTVTNYWTTDESEFDFRREKEYFSLYRVQTDLDTIQALVVPSSGLKHPRYQANHFRPPVPRLRMREVMHTSSGLRGSRSTGETAPFLLCYVNTVHFLCTV